ncbi:MAG: tetratricopeptide repeat protein [Elusimicrobia bacterium]|nr:tetratricopeptide repeat protein [Elusimicrobiota bacterium]
MQLPGVNILRRSTLLPLVIGLFLLHPASEALAQSRASLSAEIKAWKFLQKAAETNRSPQYRMKLLNWYYRSYPRGLHGQDIQFAIAETLYGQGEYDQAIAYYRRLADARESSYRDDSLLRIGEIYYNAGNINRAKEAWQRLTKLSLHRSSLMAEALYGLILCDMHTGNYVMANKSLERLKSKFPAYADLNKVREATGILRFQEKNFREAVEALEGLNTAPAAFYRGLSHFDQQQYLEAADSFHKVAGSASSRFTEIAAYLKADCFRMANNDALASRAYDGFLRDFPRSRFRANALVHLADALLRTGRFKEAMEIIQEVRKTAASREVRAYALHQGAEVAIRLKDYATALSMLSEAIGAVGRENQELYAGIQVAKGYTLLLSGRIQEAMRTLKGFVREMPHHPLSAAAFMLIGNDAYANKDWDAAISAYQTALLQFKYSPLSDVAMTMLLASFYQQKKYQDLVTNSNRLLKVVGADFATQNFLWRAYGHLILGEGYYQLKLFPQASSHYEEAIKHPSLAPWARFYLAWSRYHEEKYNEATQLAEKTLEQAELSETEKASASLLIAASHFNEKEYEAAIAAFRGFRRHYPSDERVPESWLQEGWAHLQAGFSADAIRTWSRLSTQHEDHPIAQEAQLLISRLYFQARQYKSAIATLTKFMEAWPRSALAADAQWLLAQSYYNGRQDAAAIDAYQEFLTRFRRDARVEDGRKQLEQVRYRHATQSQNTKLLAEFVAIYPKSELSSEAQYQLSQLLHKRKEWDGAIREYRKLLLNYPGTSQAPLALLSIAHILDHQRKPEAAVKEYESILKLFPTSTVAIDSAMRLGSIYFALEKYPDAARSFRFAVERQAPPEIKSAASFNLAISYKKDRSYADSLRFFGDFIRDFPQDPKRTDAMLETASLYLQLDDPVRSAATYEDLVRNASLSKSMQMEVFNQLGSIYQKMGDADRAMANYGELVTMTPRHTEARLLGLAQLAALYEKKNQWQEALGVYDDIRRSGGKPNWTRAALKRITQIRVHLKAQEDAIKNVRMEKAEDSPDAAMTDSIQSDSKTKAKAKPSEPQKETKSGGSQKVEMQTTESAPMEGDSHGTH